MIPSLARIFVYPRPVDLRQGFNGLMGLALRLGLELEEGDVVVCTNAARTACKLLYREPNGLVLLHKRLSRGRFPSLAARLQGDTVLLSHAELRLFLDACELLATFDMKGENTGKRGLPSRGS